MEAIVYMRTLVGFCCAGLIVSGVCGVSAHGEGSGASGIAAKEDAAMLVREVVYNELHDHDTHGYWRYWIEHRQGEETLLQEEVETPDGPVKRVELSNGRPLAANAREDEDRRLERLLKSPSEQAQHRKEYVDDERRIGRILALLPDAFVYEPATIESQSGEGLCYHIRYHPNAGYPARSIESRVFHAMSGELWISVQNKRLVRLDGRLGENVDFGYGILGRLFKDGWFRLERMRVSSGVGVGDWKTQRLEVHMQGRAMLFKTIARETSEVRGGFSPVPAGLSLEEAAALIRQPVRGVQAADMHAAALVSSR
jgi:hypothetical protein